MIAVQTVGQQLVNLYDSVLTVWQLHNLERLQGDGVSLALTNYFFVETRSYTRLPFCEKKLVKSRLPLVPGLRLAGKAQPCHSEEGRRGEAFPWSFYIFSP